jgi:hypothetical protein
LLRGYCELIDSDESIRHVSNAPREARRGLQQAQGVSGYCGGDLRSVFCRCTQLQVRGQRNEIMIKMIVRKSAWW